MSLLADWVNKLNQWSSLVTSSSSSKRARSVEDPAVITGAGSVYVGLLQSYFVFCLNSDPSANNKVIKMEEYRGVMSLYLRHELRNLEYTK